MHRTASNAGVLAVLIVALTSCSIAIDREKQLQAVAKDWCQTIRASQVIPVYPLTEDLRPGDVFIVEQPIHRQADEYTKKGFLPLDRQATRLPDVDYGQFYAPGYFNDKFHRIPHDRVDLRSTEETPPSGAGAAAGTSLRRKSLADQVVAFAAFPTHSFEVDRQTGLSLAIPLKGLMIGLNHMRADKAVGSVSLSSAFSYGAPADDLMRRLRIWAEYPEVRTSLKVMRLEARHRNPGVDEPFFLRVISRVYFVGEVEVALSNASASSSDLSNDEAALAKVNAGLAPLEEKVDAATATPIDPSRPAPAAPVSTTPATNPGSPPKESDEDLLTRKAQKPIPKGGVVFRSASRRSVSMSESFDRPLAIGYVGFDVPVSNEGDLGVPIATLLQLTEGSASAPSEDREDLAASALAREKLRFESSLTVLQQMANSNSERDDALTVIRFIAGHMPDLSSLNSLSVADGTTDNIRDKVNELGYRVRQYANSSQISLQDNDDRQLAFLRSINDLIDLSMP